MDGLIIFLLIRIYSSRIEEHHKVIIFQTSSANTFIENQ